MKTLKLSGAKRTVQLEKRTPTSIDRTFEGFHQFQKDDGEPYGSFEVFYADDSRIDQMVKEAEENFCFHEASSINEDGPGWYWHAYWHACFPGCLPDSDCGPHGPFPTAEGAYLDAQGE